MSAAAATQVAPPNAPPPTPATPSVEPGKVREKALDESRWQPVLRLPCELTVEIPVPGFTVADLLKLQIGSVIATGWGITRDVPLRANGALIGWSEFEVVGKHIAVRLTELA